MFCRSAINARSSRMPTNPLTTTSQLPKKHHVSNSNHSAPSPLAATEFLPVPIAAAAAAHRSSSPLLPQARGTNLPKQLERQSGGGMERWRLRRRGRRCAGVLHPDQARGGAARGVLEGARGPGLLRYHAHRCAANKTERNHACCCQSRIVFTISSRKLL